MSNHFPLPTSCQLVYLQCVFLFVEAEMAKNRIEELKLQEFQRRREELIFNQTKEREEVEQAHIMEYQEFNKNWDDTLAQIEVQD